MKRRPIHPAIRRIHDLLYLGTKDGRQSRNPEKDWDADTMTAIADVVAKYIPRPRST